MAVAAPEPAYFRNYTFEMVRVADLKIDPTYHPQSRYKDWKARWMGAHWQPDAVGTLTVSQRTGGALILIEGNHRRAGAIYAGVEYLPAKVFHGLTVEQEAAVWYWESQKTAITTAHRWENRRVWKDPVVLDVERILAECGVHVLLVGQASQTPNATRAVALAEYIYHASPELLRSTFQIARQAWPEESRALEGRPIQGISSFLWCYRKTNPSADERRLLDRLRLTSPEKIIADVGKAREVHVGPLARGQGPASFSVQRRVVLAIYNYGLQGRRLPDLSYGQLVAISRLAPDAKLDIRP